MKRILAISLSPLGAGWAFGAINCDRPMSGLMSFGSNSNTDDEVWRNATKEVLESIKFHGANMVAITAVPDMTASAHRLYDLSVATRLVVKWALPGAAKLVDMGNAIECLTGTAHHANPAAAEHAVMQEVRRRGWLSDDRQPMVKALALAIWCYAASQQMPELAFGKARAVA